MKNRTEPSSIYKSGDIPCHSKPLNTSHHMVNPINYASKGSINLHWIGTHHTLRITQDQWSRNMLAQVYMIYTYAQIVILLILFLFEEPSFLGYVHICDVPKQGSVKYP